MLREYSENFMYVETSLSFECTHFLIFHITNLQPLIISILPSKQMGNNRSWEQVIERDVALQYLDYDKELRIISVGSGLGKWEKSFENETKRQIICVDPDPESFNRPNENESEDIYHRPDFPLVDDLIKFDPSVVGNCILLLLWPTPNLSTYDIEAVFKLKPNHVVTVYETIGGAGGEQFHIWLQEVGAPNGNYRSNESSFIKKQAMVPYRKVACYEKGTRSFYDQTFCLCLLTKEKVKKNVILPSRDYDDQPTQSTQPTQSAQLTQSILRVASFLDFQK